jgi:hypothetical protein
MISMSRARAVEPETISSASVYTSIMVRSLHLGLNSIDVIINDPVVQRSHIQAKRNALETTLELPDGVGKA